MSNHTPSAETGNTPASYRDETAYPLTVGQQVNDIRQLVTPDDVGTAVVVDTVETVETVDGDEEDATVFNVSFGPVGNETTLADYDLNQHYADFEVSDRVVMIRWDSWLDANVPRWTAYRDDPADLREFLREQEASWGIPVAANGYSYPESRLVPIE